MSIDGLPVGLVEQRVFVGETLSQPQSGQGALRQAEKIRAELFVRHEPGCSCKSITRLQGFQLALR
ncbi:hypothetical protein [Mesorhizobium sp. 113-3-3]|uniref:hypothetical protein n=1 Tax=Mesorhizobium sp. 113-3-3 TaxID=2744516 RepID=UPI0019261CE7|nr:hypothetical protein [Mesorhizobium sp. 113-3-3]